MGDTDSGHIDFNELVSHVMGKDITEMQFYERRAREDEAKVAAQIAAGPAPRVLTDWPKSMTYHRSSFEDIMVLIRQKIVERTKRPSGALAYFVSATCRPISLWLYARHTQCRPIPDSVPHVWFSTRRHQQGRLEVPSAVDEYCHQRRRDRSIV